MALSLANQKRLHQIIDILLEQQKLNTGPEGHIRIPLNLFTELGLADTDQLHNLVGYLEKNTNASVTDEFFSLLNRTKNNRLEFALIRNSLKENLIVKIPNPDKLLQFQKLLKNADPLDDTPEPLSWIEKDHIISWGKYGQHIIPNTRHALILFLNILWPKAGTGTLSNQLLAAEYDRYCEKMQQRYKDNEKTPQYLRTRYQNLSSKNMGKKADRCVKELRDIFGIAPGRYFPIENQGTLADAAWVWHKVNPTKPKHSFD